MAGYRVDLEALSVLRDRLARAEREFERCVDDADTAVKRLHGEWSGAAADEQRAAQQRWCAGSREMHEALRALTATVSAAQERYSAARAANLAMWG